MSECTVPDWNLKHQRQEQLGVGEERNRSYHVQFPSTYHRPLMYDHEYENSNTRLSYNYSSIDNMDDYLQSNYQVAELTWENGQPTMQATHPTAPIKPTWGSGDTLESIVQQATCHKKNQSTVSPDHAPKNVTFLYEAISDGQLDKHSGPKRPQTLSGSAKKRTRSDSEHCGAKYGSNNVKEEGLDHSMCASASATFCREDDTTMMTWASFESPRSLRTKTSEDDSESHGGSENRDEDRENKDEIGHSSQSTRRNRAAAIHNLSERRRRDRINQKMKALQMLVPNASKTDKASMLDEVIEYLKQLQAQVNMMSYRHMPQMVVPIGISPQQLHMAMLSRMQGVGVGLGMGMGMFDVSTLARATTPQTMSSPLMHPTSNAAATTQLVSPHFMVPAMIPTPSPSTSNSDSGTNASLHVPDPYCAFLAQKMNMDLYSKMAALYGQQFRPSPTSQATSGASQSSRVQRDY